MTIQILHLIIYVSIFGQYFSLNRQSIKIMEKAYNNFDFYLGMLFQFQPIPVRGTCRMLVDIIISQNAYYS